MNNEALEACQIYGCEHNRISTGYENGPNLHYVQCASPWHVIKVYGPTLEIAIKRWNTRQALTPEVDLEKPCNPLNMADEYMSQMRGFLQTLKDENHTGKFLSHNLMWQLDIAFGYVTRTEKQLKKLRGILRGDVAGETTSVEAIARELNAMCDTPDADLTWVVEHLMNTGRMTIPSGYVLVPEEPTESMIESCGRAYAGHLNGGVTLHQFYYDLYKAMIKAARE